MLSDVDIITNVLIINRMSTSISKDSEEKIEKLEEKYPVEQIAIADDKNVSEKEVESAVKELNPDKNSLGYRG